MIACMNYSLGLNQHQGGGLGQMVEIVIIWPAFPSPNYAHRFSSDVTDGRGAEISPFLPRSVQLFARPCGVGLVEGRSLAGRFLRWP